jgi:hypothetical protein
MHWVASHCEALYGHVFSLIWINHNCVIRWDVPILLNVMVQYALGILLLYHNLTILLSINDIWPILSYISVSIVISWRIVYSITIIL